MSRVQSAEASNQGAASAAYASHLHALHGGEGAGVAPRVEAWARAAGLAPPETMSYYVDWQLPAVRRAQR